MNVDAAPAADRETAVDVRLRELMIAFVGFAIAAIVMTLPLWQHPTRRLPSDLVDTLLNTWIIGWDADRLRHGLVGLWDAPIYYPYRNTLAFSENLLGIAVLVAPVYWITGNPILTYNVELIVSFAIAGVGMYLLATSLTRSRRSGVIAAAFYAFCSFRFIELSHIQFIATGWLPIALYGLHRYFSTGRRGYLGTFGVGCALQALSNSYVAYFMALPIASVALDGLRRERTRRARRLAELAVAAATIVVALAPVGLRYSRVRSDYGHVRRLAELEEGSADVRSYFIGRSSMGVWRWLRAGEPGEAEKDLFPGVVAIVLAAIALGHLRGRRDDVARWVSVYGLIAVAALVLSLGPHVRVWGHLVTTHGPYDWLLRVVPGMNGMRVPARFAIIFFLGLSVLVGFGARLSAIHVPARARSLATAIAVLAILAESCAVPLPLHSYGARGRPADRAVAEWLGGRLPGAVLHLPVRTSSVQELNYQFATLFHSHPIVNGMSGYDSPLQLLFRGRDSVLYDNDRPSAVVRMLRSLGVRYVVINQEDYNVTQLANDEHRLALGLLRSSGQVVREERLLDAYVFELERPIAPPAAEPVVPIDRRELSVSVSEAEDRVAYLTDGNRDTRWIGGQRGTSWIAATLARPANIARVDMRLAERSLSDHPRELEVDAVDAGGATRVLYRATPYSEFVAAFVRDPSYPRITIALPDNQTATLVIRETGQAAGRWWSVHELQLWRRTSR